MFWRKFKAASAAISSTRWFPFPRFNVSSLLPRHSEAITDRHHHEIDAFVGPDFCVKSAQGFRILILDRGLGNASAPQDVINQYDAAGAQKFQAAFVVGVVGRF